MTKPERFGRYKLSGIKKMIEKKLASFEKLLIIESEEADEVTHGSFFGENIKRLKKLFR